MHTANEVIFCSVCSKVLLLVKSDSGRIVTKRNHILCHIGIKIDSEHCSTLFAGTLCERTIINNPINVTENKWFIIVHRTRTKKKREGEKRTEKNFISFRLYTNNVIQLRSNWINESAMRKRYTEFSSFLSYKNCECREFFFVWYRCVCAFLSVFTVALRFQHDHRPAEPFILYAINWIGCRTFSFLLIFFCHASFVNIAAMRPSFY